jgi:hypothetical protein
LEGDFDIEVTYRLLTWPSANGVRVGLGAFAVGVVARASLGSSLDYPGHQREIATVNVGGAVTNIECGAMSGRLRLVRSATIWIGLMWDGGKWIEIARVTGPASPVRVDVGAWSHDYAFTDQDVVVAFDDFKINNGVGCDFVVETRSSTWGRIRALYR